MGKFHIEKVEAYAVACADDAKGGILALADHTRNLQAEVEWLENELRRVNKERKKISKGAERNAHRL